MHADQMVGQFARVLGGPLCGAHALWCPFDELPECGLWMARGRVEGKLSKPRDDFHGMLVSWVNEWAEAPAWDDMIGEMMEDGEVDDGLLRDWASHHSKLLQRGELHGLYACPDCSQVSVSPCWELSQLMVVAEGDLARRRGGF